MFRRLCPLLFAALAACSTKPPCGPTTCDGCCEPSGACKDGVSASACGRQGATCVACGPAQLCSSGSCQPVDGGTGADGGACGECDPHRSDGCANGTCLCGTGAACGAGQRCAGATCLCDSASECHGCCEGASCLVQTSLQACGSNGATCELCEPTVADNCGALGCQCGAAAACTVDQVCVAGVCTSPSWTLLQPSPRPAAREGASLAFDSDRGVSVLFGGTASGGELGGVWEWSGSAWTHAQPASGPPARSYAAMAYDPISRKVVVFGGYGLHALSDTWLWDGSAWSPLSSAVAPDARFGSAMVFDGSLQKLVMFGGTDGVANYYSDTWVLDSSGWSQLNVSGPAGQIFFAMAYDAIRQRTVLFSGLSRVRLTDTWELSASGWEQIAVTGPPLTVKAASAWDGRAQAFVLLGGNDATGAFTTAGYQYGGTWTPMSAPLPTPGRSGAAMVYDSNRRRLVMVGGNTSAGQTDELWER